MYDGKNIKIQFFAKDNTNIMTWKNVLVKDVTVCGGCCVVQCWDEYFVKVICYLINFV